MAAYTQTQAGDWNTNATWGGSGHPVAGDTATMNSNYNMTIGSAAACATLNMTGYTGTMSGTTFALTVSNGATIAGAFSGWTTGTITVTGGGVTLAGTATGTAFPKISLTTAGGTLTSGGYTWPGPLSFGYVGTFTLSGNWITGGTTFSAAAFNLNKTSTETYTANGGVSVGISTGTTGTAPVIINGTITQTGGAYLWTCAAGLTLGSSAVINSSYVGGFTITGGGLTLLGNITSIGSSLNTISFSTVGQTITANGHTINANITMSFGGTYVLNGNLGVYGLWFQNVAGNVVLNQTTNETLTLYGGLQLGSTSRTMSGTVPIYLVGGTFTCGASDYLQNNLYIQPSYATVVISGNVYYQAGTITYVPSSFGVTVSGSTLNLSNTGGAATLNTNTLVWNNITIVTTATYTISSNLNCNGTLTIPAGNNTISGAYNITVGTIVNTYSANTYTLTFTGGATLTVNNSLTLMNNPGYSQLLTSSNTTPVNLVYLGTAANLIVANYKFTYINANIPIYDWGATTSQISNCSNIFPGNQSLISTGGFFIQ